MYLFNVSYDYFLFLINTYINQFTSYYFYFFSCVLIVFFIIKSAPYIGLIDTPSHRSSHRHPTPCGGGLAFVLIILLSNLNLITLCPQYFIGALMLSTISFWDDIKPRSIKIRLIVQFISVFLMITTIPDTLEYIRDIPIWIIKIVLFVAGIWFINLYNFMDGIDGLASGYANAASIGFLFCIHNGLIIDEWNIKIYYQMIFISLAFLIFNWHPAKVFLGDVGSTFLGYTFFALGLNSLQYNNFLVPCFLIIMSFFWVDATLTLLRRLFKGEKIYEAHRKHAFQNASKIYGQWKVTAFIILFTILWLNPMAKITLDHYYDHGLLYFLISVFPVFMIVLHFKPGLDISK